MSNLRFVNKLDKQSQRKIQSKLVTAILLLIYCIKYVHILLNHEIWRDEVQPFAIAASSPSIHDLLANMQYEGRPPLWFFILFFASKLSQNPEILKIVAAMIFFATTLTVLSLKKINIFYKLLILAGFYFSYGYSVTSRDYNLLLLFTVICIKLFEKRNVKVWQLCCLLLLIGVTNGFGLILALFWSLFGIVHVDSLRQKINIVVILGSNIFILFVQFLFSPPSDSAFAVDNESFSIAGLRKSLANILVYPFLPIHHQEVPTTSMIITALVTSALVIASVVSFSRKTRTVFTFGILLIFLQSTFGYYLYWWHFGSVFLIYISCAYYEWDDNKSFRLRRTLISIVLSFQVIGSFFGLGEDFSSDRKYSNLKTASEIVEHSCFECIVVVDTSVLGGPLSQFVKPIPVFTLDSHRFIEYTSWKKSMLMPVSQKDVESSNAYFKNFVLLTSRDYDLNPKQFKLVAKLKDSVWGDNFLIYTSVTPTKGNN